MQSAMQKLDPYFRLMRLHQPVGVWLVYWPCAWAICLAAMQAVAGGADKHALTTLAALYIPLFFLGALATRSAGCIINDMADRELDKHVARTKTRPLASGELRLSQAFAALAATTLLALAVLGTVLHSLPHHVAAIELFYVTLPVIALITAYPFMKRITWWPQAFLGLTFNWGIFISWFAVQGSISAAAILLYAACFFWTLGYDTIYGHQDKKDDEKIGIKSTSRRLGNRSKIWIGGFYAVMVVLFALAAYSARLSPAGVIVSTGILAGVTATQLRHWQPDDPADCMRVFRENVRSGMILALWLMMLLLVG